VLRDHRVVQLSLRRCAASIEDRNLLGHAVQELVTALAELEEPVIPYFRDFDAAHSFWLMPQLELLAHRLSVPVLGEGARSTVDAMFEDYPELHQQYVPIVVDEPSFRAPATSCRPGRATRRSGVAASTPSAPSTRRCSSPIGS